MGRNKNNKRDKQRQQQEQKAARGLRQQKQEQKASELSVLGTLLFSGPLTRAGCSCRCREKESPSRRHCICQVPVRCPDRSLYSKLSVCSDCFPSLGNTMGQKKPN